MLVLNEMVLILNPQFNRLRLRVPPVAAYEYENNQEALVNESLFEDDSNQFLDHRIPVAVHFHNGPRLVGISSNCLARVLAIVYF